MENPRYEKFVSLVDSVHKSIRKLKLDEAPGLGIKGVHIFWLRHLKEKPDGLTAAELASAIRVDRSLISREIEDLESAGYVTLLPDSRKYVLTESGAATADEITKKAIDIQSAVNEGITEKELIAFYETFEKLRDNFAKISANPTRRRRAE